MTITREHLEKAAKAVGIEVEEAHGMLWSPKYSFISWKPNIDHGQLLDLAMACRVVIDPIADVIEYPCGDGASIVDVNCQDFPALAEAVILAACEQFDAKGGE